MIPNPLRLLRRRRRLRQAIEDETFYLQRLHGASAHAVALEKLKRDDLTSWGRQVVEGAARRLEPGPVAGDRNAGRPGTATDQNGSGRLGTWLGRIGRMGQGNRN